jgi:hypothetical protein
MQPPITDPAVTLTDYGLAIECAVIVMLLLRRKPNDPELRFWFAVFFASVCVASLLGGTVHGFFKDPASKERAILWPATLISILVTGLAAWFAASALHLRGNAKVAVGGLALAQLAILAFVVLFVSRAFFVAIIGYLPATLFLLFALASAYRQRKVRPLRWGVTGLVLTLLAAGVQRRGIGFHPVTSSQRTVSRHSGAAWMIFMAADRRLQSGRREGGQMLSRREFLSLAAGWAGAVPAGMQAWPVGNTGDVAVNDVHSHQLTRVRSIARPEPSKACRPWSCSALPRQALSIAGGRHAMGGQQFGTDTTLLDMNGLSRVLEFDRVNGEIEVEAGMQWPELYKYLVDNQRDSTPSWSFIQKQTGADKLSIGGALAANIHGRGLTSDLHW